MALERFSVKLLVTLSVFFETLVKNLNYIVSKQKSRSILRNARIIDGTGGPSQFGNPKDRLLGETSKFRQVDVRGKVVCP